MDSDREITRILEEIRLRIEGSELSLRKVEAGAGFSRGYLSQLLARNLDLKVRHLLAILDVLGIQPAEFFASLYPVPPRAVLEVLAERRAMSSRSTPDGPLDDLLQLGVESFHDLRGRVERCERAVSRLQARGLVERVPDSEL